MVPTGVLGVFGSVLFQRNGTHRRFECFFGNVFFQRDGATPSVVIRFFNSTQPLPSHPAATVSSADALPPLASSAAAARLSKPKTLRSLGDILEDWGLSKHSALWSWC